MFSLHKLNVLIIQMLNCFLITYSILINNILYDFLFFKKKTVKMYEMYLFYEINLFIYLF